MERPPILKLAINTETELRLLEEGDAPEVFALIDKDRAHLRPWLPWLDATRSIEDERDFIRHTTEHYAHSQGLACVIVHQGRIVGCIGYNTIDWANRKTEIGYWLGKTFEGKGLMTQACEELIRFGFQVLELNKIEIRCATGNTRSCAIPRRLGFTQEGVIRQGEWLYDHYVDLILFGMLVSEWKR